MQAVIALVGRPNVGKSTLFNRLTKSRDALVADYAGLTRDRRYGFMRIEGRQCLLVDTGGIDTDTSGEVDVLNSQVQVQTGKALEEADIIVWLTDAREGLTSEDQEIAKRLRVSGKPLIAVVNKMDGLDIHEGLSDFHRLGFSELIPISAAHGRGMDQLLSALSSLLPEGMTEPDEMQLTDAELGIRVAIVGRPNAGKSTLVNRLLGQERMLTDSTPGTTRDSIESAIERDGQRYVLIDTAGVRRKSRIYEQVEKLSVIKALQVIESAHVVIVLLNAQDSIADQDSALLGLVIESGRSIVIAVNKWDGLPTEQRETIEREMDRKLIFCTFAERMKISALHGTGVGLLLGAVQKAYRSATLDVPTAKLTKLLEEAVATHQPPIVKGRRIKLRYAHQGGRNPPRIIIHGNQTHLVPGSYERYLQNFFREKLGVVGTPLRMEFKTGENPYSARQKRHR